MLIGHMDNQRIDPRTTLHVKDFTAGLGIKGMGCKAINSLGRQGDDFPRLQVANH
jgi:hypothetical protein